MNRLILISFLAFSLVVGGCAKKNVATKSNTTQGVSGDGSSFENAVIAESIPSEYEWIRKNYPGAKVVSQALVSQGKSNYDVLTTKLPDGSTKKFYFNIDSFFGKGF